MKVPVTVSKKPRIEMLPLIDVVFLLLVFFILAMLSMAVHRGIKVNLPVSETAGIEKKLVVSISIDAAGTVFLDKNPVNLDDLTDSLKNRNRLKPVDGVLLFADKTVPYQKLYEVIDRIELAGISRLSLQADKDRQ